MKRIIYHWTGGGYYPNQTDLLHYHYVIDVDGKVHQGVYSVQDNENCADKVYAQHTGGGNTGSIGISFCGMAGYKGRQNVGKYPLIQKQCEAGFKLGAELVKKYKLDLSNKETIQTHYGFGKRHPKTESAGKIDITFLPYAAYLNSDDIEDFIREKVKWYYSRLA